MRHHQSGTHHGRSMLGLVFFGLAVWILATGQMDPVLAWPLAGSLTLLGASWVFKS